MNVIIILPVKPPKTIPNPNNKLYNAKHSPLLSLGILSQIKLEAAKLKAQSEIERAKGVAEANKIIGNSLKGNESYLRYLWIQNIDNPNETIYVPTEAGLPILEAGKRRRK